MKRQKRDICERAYAKGYYSGLRGRSRDNCPHIDGPARQEWLGGWRDGRADQWDGYTGVSGLHKLVTT